MSKRGRFSDKDKEFIESHQEWILSRLAKKLDRTEQSVNNYLDSIVCKSGESYDESKDSPDGSRVMTERLSEAGDNIKNIVFPGRKYNDSVTTIKDK